MTKNWKKWTDQVMKELGLRSKCSVNDNRTDNTFVGILSEHGSVNVRFPLGYHLSEDDKGVRSDILLLINSIAATQKRRESELKFQSDAFIDTGFPIQSYMYILKDYVERGYYRERETEYVVSRKGKIHWNRTIKTIDPVVNNGNVYYLDFAIKKNEIHENELITLIHKYCVRESFDKIGWLFTSFVPDKSSLKFNRKMFLSVLKEKTERTFNDRNRALFRHMMSVVMQEYDPDAPSNYMYGTNRFEYVWESLIDQVYGITEKNLYFPKTAWMIKGRKYDNASLEPDSIMLWNDDIYVLDAKYYKYGQSHNSWELPESSSINKQITYGEYVDRIKKTGQTVYNAFLMPCNASSWETERPVINLGEAVSDWKTGDKEYERIQGILVDVKYLMKERSRKDRNTLEMMAKAISEAFDQMKKE